jgi:hypothetical protein
MRPPLALLCACLTALVAATAGASDAAPALSLQVTPVAVRAVGSSRAPSGRRDYAVSFRVAVSSPEPCANLVVEYSYKALFDGRESLAGSALDYYETNGPASTAAFDVHAGAGAGDVVVFSGHASCENDDGDVVATSDASARSAVPVHACEEGPLRVFAASSVRRQDLRSQSRTVPVASGHRLWTGYRVLVGRRGRIVFGASECRGLRVSVGGPASLVPGDYARRSYGTSTLLGYGAAADFRGDQHSGGVETANAVAIPRGRRLGPSNVARFEIVSLPRRLGRITRVHVRRGQVYVAGRGARGYGPAIVLGPGQRTVVSCRAGCRPARPEASGPRFAKPSYAGLSATTFSRAASR